MSKKVLNTNSVMNELKGQSAFFNAPKSQGDSPELRDFTNPPSQTVAKPKRTPKTNEKSEIVFERTTERPNVRNNERIKIRHTFDIFKDQLQELHTRQLKIVQSGGAKPKLGKMVQQALDLYFKNDQDSKPIEKRSSERPNEPSDERTNDQI